jgi:hypothetical protein
LKTTSSSFSGYARRARSKKTPHHERSHDSNTTVKIPQSTEIFRFARSYRKTSLTIPDASDPGPASPVHPVRNTDFISMHTHPTR